MKIACLAQLVNVIAPIMTEPGGKAWRQPIFFPFADVAHLAQGVALRQAVEAEAYSSKSLGALTYLLTSTTHDAARKRICVFALNRHLAEEMEFSLEMRGVPGSLALVESRTLAGFDFAATNSPKEEIVRPTTHSHGKVEGSMLKARLKPASWNVFALNYA